MRSWQRQAVIVLLISTVTMVTACASAGRPGGSSSRSGTGGGSAASCARLDVPSYLASARVAFTATALPGPAAGAASVLTSPARFGVIKYLKGSGPPVVTVQTALTGSGNATVLNEDGIQPQAGQQWEIYTQSLRPPYRTSICDGSCVMSGTADGVNIPCPSQRQGT